jgi:hypothetical protein
MAPLCVCAACTAHLDLLNIDQYRPSIKTGEVTLNMIDLHCITLKRKSVVTTITFLDIIHRLVFIW